MAFEIQATQPSQKLFCAYRQYLPSLPRGGETRAASALFASSLVHCAAGGTFAFCPALPRSTQFENPRLRSKSRPPVVSARALLCIVACVVHPGPQQHSVRIEDPPNGIARYQRVRYAGCFAPRSTQ
ncbi:hypothetical protein MRX96_055704 [Rhipicephalus microplus]